MAKGIRLEKPKTRKKTQTTPGAPGATFADLGTKYKKKPKYRHKPRQKSIPMEGIDLIRQLNDSIREKNPLEQALNEVGLEFSGDDMDEYDADDMDDMRDESPEESGENDEMVEYMRELMDSGEAEDATDAANRACDCMELEGEEREQKVAQLVDAYNASYGEDEGMDEDDLEAATRDDTRIDRNVPQYEPSEEEESDEAIHHAWRAAKADNPYLSYEDFRQRRNERRFGPDYPHDRGMPGPKDPRWSRTR